ncbi:MAG: hypothetical protein KGJ95_10475 [Candidatus Omnitrophica bacterium]|nr:hypothetical protein [Candidatus Omnitrophota bacterium]
MTDTMPECREEFEKWIKNTHVIINPKIASGLGWDCWQAAWNAKHDQLEQRCRELEAEVSSLRDLSTLHGITHLRAKLKAAEGMREAINLEKKLIAATVKKTLNGYRGGEDFESQSLVKMWNEQLNRLDKSIKNFDSVEG